MPRALSAASLIAAPWSAGQTLTTSLTLPNAAAAGDDPAADAAPSPAPLDWLAGLEAPPSRRRARLIGSAMIGAVVLALAGGVGFAVWRADEPIVSATLSAPAKDGGAPLYRARLEPRRHHAILTPVGEPRRLDARHARQLWLMRSYGPPVALGLVDPARTTVFPVAPELTAKDNPPTHLFVTRERAGGSAKDFPQGPTVAEAALPQGS